MAATSMQVTLPYFRSTRTNRWQELRDLLGGALLLALSIALWTATWAAVAGPLSAAPAEPDGRIAEYRGP